MPYRIDISSPPDDVLDDVLQQLVQVGALDIEEVGRGLAAIIPDHCDPVDAVARAEACTA